MTLKIENMKNLKFGLIFFLSNAVFANQVIGVGEYNYGPDLSENIACQMAEDRAKEHAINKFLGESIKIVVSESCKNETCELEKETNNESRGVIKSVLSKTEKHSTHLGFKKCIVTIKAEVEKVTNQIKFEVFGKYPHYKHNDNIRFSGLSNSEGYVYVFNKYNGEFSLIHRQQIFSNQKFQIPSNVKEEVVAILPNGQNESKEMLTFLFSEKEINVQANYTQNDFNLLVRSLPFDKHRVINQYVYIMRSI